MYSSKYYSSSRRGSESATAGNNNNGNTNSSNQTYQNSYSTYTANNNPLPPIPNNNSNISASSLYSSSSHSSYGNSGYSSSFSSMDSRYTPITTNNSTRRPSAPTTSNPNENWDNMAREKANNSNVSSLAAAYSNSSSYSRPAREESSAPISNRYSSLGRSSVTSTQRDANDLSGAPMSRSSVYSSRSATSSVTSSSMSRSYSSSQQQPQQPASSTYQASSYQAPPSVTQSYNNSTSYSPPSQPHSRSSSISSQGQSSFIMVDNTPVNHEDPYGVIVDNLKPSEVFAYVMTPSHSPVDKRRAIVRLSAVADENEARSILDNQLTNFLQYPECEWYLDTLSHSLRKLFVMAYLRSDQDVENRLRVLRGIVDHLLIKDDEVFGSCDVIEEFSIIFTQSIKSEAFKAYFGHRPELLMDFLKLYTPLSPRFQLKKPLTHLLRSLHRSTLADHHIDEDIPFQNRWRTVLVADVLFGSGRSPQVRRAALLGVVAQGAGTGSPLGGTPLTYFSGARRGSSDNLSSSTSISTGRSLSRDRNGMGGRSGSQGGLNHLHPIATSPNSGESFGIPNYAQNIAEFRANAVRMVQDPDFLHFSDLFFNAILSIEASSRSSVTPLNSAIASTRRRPSGTEITELSAGNAQLATWCSDLLHHLALRSALHSALLRSTRSAESLQRLFDILQSADPSRAALIQASQPWVEKFSSLPVQAQDVVVGVLSLRHPGHSRLAQMVVDHHLAMSHMVESWTRAEEGTREEKQRKEEERERNRKRVGRDGNKRSSVVVRDNGIGGIGSVSLMDGRKKFQFGVSFSLEGDAKETGEQATVDMHLAMSYVIEAETVKMLSKIRPEQDVVDEHYKLSYEIERETKAKLKAAMDAALVEQMTVDLHYQLSYLIEAETRKEEKQRLKQADIDDHLAQSYELEAATRKDERIAQLEQQLHQTTVDHHLALSYLIEQETVRMLAGPYQSSFPSIPAQQIVDEHLALSYELEDRTRKLHNLPPRPLSPQETVDSHLALSYEIEDRTRRTHNMPSRGAISEPHRIDTRGPSESHERTKRINLEKDLARILEQARSAPPPVETLIDVLSRCLRGDANASLPAGGMSRGYPPSPPHSPTHTLYTRNISPVPTMAGSFSSSYSSATTAFQGTPIIKSSVVDRLERLESVLEERHGGGGARVERLEMMVEGLFGLLGVTLEGHPGQGYRR
ncbi:hypothetical protein HDU97_005187 [Phlyctochytrium planicorne]|nr:hypothetical protein HDU97_005187 [Phlyctochytrium planicorne]